MILGRGLITLLGAFVLCYFLSSGLHWGSWYIKEPDISPSLALPLPPPSRIPPTPPSRKHEVHSPPPPVSNLNSRPPPTPTFQNRRDGTCHFKPPSRHLIRNHQLRHPRPSLPDHRELARFPRWLLGIRTRGYSKYRLLVL